MAPPQEPPAPPPPPLKLSRGERIGLIGLVVSIIGVVVAIVKLPGVLDDGGNEPPQRARLTVDQLIVRNPVPDQRSIGSRSVYTSESTPTIDVALRNTGHGRAVVVEAEAKIVDYADIQVCYVQGGGDDLPVAKYYDLKLPFKPRPTERLARSQFVFHIEAGGIGRFAFLLTGPPDDDPHLYGLDVSLRTRGGAGTIDLGRFVVATQGPIPRAGGYLPEEQRYFEPAGVGILALQNLWCYERNVVNVRRLVGAPGRRSDEIRALDDVEVLPEFQRALERVPPRAAAQRLLDEIDPNGDPSLAVLAAERTDDAAFEARIRRRAADILYRRAAAALDRDPAGAIEQARTALEILETPELVRLLRDAERRAAG